MALQLGLINTVSGDSQMVIQFGTTTVCTGYLVLWRAQVDILIMTGTVTLAAKEAGVIMVLIMSTAPMAEAPIQIAVTVTAALLAETRLRFAVQRADNQDHHVQPPLLEVLGFHQETVALQVVVSNRIAIKDTTYEH